MPKADGVKQSFLTNPSDGSNPQSISDLIYNFRDNFLNREVEIMDGLTFNQYEIIKRAYYYSHNQFMSGPYDEHGNKKYFYDLMTNRNQQATKSIDLDTKDVYIKSTSEGSYLKSWLLRKEFMQYSKENNFGQKLNNMCENLPRFGSHVWKKIKDDDGDTDVRKVDLKNLINDPTADKLIDGITIERSLFTQSELKEKDKWDQEVVDDLIASGKSVAKEEFLTTGTESSGDFHQQVDESTPYYEIYEFWGEIPKWMFEKYKGRDLSELTKTEKADKLKEIAQAKSSAGGKMNESVYVMAVVAGIEQGDNEHILFLREAKKEQFPYEEVHFRDVEGRWLGLGNYELCFDLIEKANELTNRYFSSLRVAMMHLYQTRDKTHVKNVFTDLLDGEIVVNKQELTPIATETRGFSQFKEAIERIEQKADELTNAFEVVTGENLPAGTPFRLGRQQLESANKLFQFTREKMGLFIENVFNNWMLDSFGDKISKEHILDILDDADDLDLYFESRRKVIQYRAIKRFVLEENRMPPKEQIQAIGELAKTQLKKVPKQIKVSEDYYTDFDYSIKVVITDEKSAKKQNLETLSNTFQALASNPQALQDSRLMKIFNRILEESGFSPIELDMIQRTETNPDLNPANQGGANEQQQAQQGQQGAQQARAGQQTGGEATEQGASSVQSLIQSVAGQGGQGG